MSKVYLLQYPSGKWVQRDDSSGPMSTGGCPFPVDSIERATFWYDKDEALKYAHTCKSDGFKLYWFEASPKLATVSPAEKARAAEDKEYLEYIRLAQKYGVVELPKCGFNEAWVGSCKMSAVPGELRCEAHLKKKCYKCGEQAVKTCGHTSQFVCGTPTCAQHQCHADG